MREGEGERESIRGEEKGRMREEGIEIEREEGRFPLSYGTPLSLVVRVLSSSLSYHVQSTKQSSEVEYLSCLNISRVLL